MAVTSELAFPESEERFEEMCFHLYRKEWNDPGCTRLGGVGQRQYGLDIIGTSGVQQIGVQCKHYIKKPFTLDTVEADLKKADDAGLAVNHIIFATSAANKSDLVLRIRELSTARRKAGKSTVSVAFWQELSGMLRLNKEVAREYIPGFPGGTLLRVEERVEATLAIVKSSSETEPGFRAEIREKLTEIGEQVASANAVAALPQSQGSEVEPLIAKNLDIVRNKLLETRPKEALELLDSLGSPDLFRDAYSRFRWHTNRAAAQLLQGHKVEAARGYLTAAAITPQLEKAWSNRAHAHLLLENTQQAMETSRLGLEAFPESPQLWALHVAAKQLAGDADPERDVPEHLRDTPDVLFALSHIRQKQGRLFESVDLIRRCARDDAGSLEVRRSFLAAALVWATEDPAAAHHDQLLPEQREALESALHLLEPLEVTIVSQQVESISMELNSNVCIALVLSRSLGRARTIAATALARHPLLEGPLQVRVRELDDKDDLAGLHALGDGRYEELPTSTVLAFAEIAANRGELAWYQEIKAVLEGRERTKHQATELRALTVHAHWKAEDPNAAMTLAMDILNELPKHVLTRVLLTRILLGKGELAAGFKHMDLALAALQPDSPVGDVLLVADLLYGSDRYTETSALYELVFKAPANNKITHHYLVSLIESGQRRKASEILETVPAEVRDLPSFRRIESNLARKMGDWARMRDLLRHELERMPTDSGIALGYMGALHRTADGKEALRVYLASDPVYDGKQPFNEVEVAKYQSQYGFASFALRRLYRTFRAHPTDQAIGGYFLAKILLEKEIPDILIAPTVAGSGAVVHLRAGTEVRQVAVDFDDLPEVATWPELVSPSSGVAEALRGKAVGDAVTLTRGFGDVEYEVVSISSLYHFVAGKVQKLLADTASPGGPLWSFNLEGVDGSPNIEPLLEMMRHRSTRVSDALHLYSQSRFPLATLAQLVGSEPLTLLLDWPRSKASLFVALGTQEERESALSLLRAGDKPVVIDLPTLGELVGAGVFRAIAPLLGRLLVPQSAREELENLIHVQATALPSMSVREEDGHFIREEITQKQHDRRLELLHEMHSCIDELCEVTPVLGPKDISDTHRVLEKALDVATLDAVYLALERDALLLSEDGGLRITVPEVGLRAAIGVQPLLMFAAERGAIKPKTYSEIVVAKIVRNHSFVSVRGDDMLRVAIEDPNNVDASVVATLQTFRSSYIQIVSAVYVCGRFLATAVSLCAPPVITEYFRLCLEVLQHGRPDVAQDVHEALVAAVKEGIDAMPKKRGTALKRQLSKLLTLPVSISDPIRETPVALAVRVFITWLRQSATKP